MFNYFPNTYSQFNFVYPNFFISLHQLKLKQMENNKKCTGCKKEQPMGSFYKNKLVHDGHSNYCVECTRVNSKKYFQRKKERVNNVENDNLVRKVLLSDSESTNADNLMKVIMIEKMCKSIMDEVSHLKQGFIKMESEVIR